MATTKLSVFGLSIALTSTACFVGEHGLPPPPPPLSGSWESDERVGGYRNTLDIADDLTGASTIYFYVEDDPTLYVADYTANAFEFEEGDGYLVSMVCGSDCSDFDFTMTCLLIEDEYLDCTGSDRFASYDVLLFTRS